MKKNRNRIILLILILIIFLTPLAFGLPSASYDFYVYDEAHILDDYTENYIIAINNELSQKTGAQVVIATINSLDNMDINTYATALFKKWEIGSKKYDNGLLLLIVPSENELWIEVGYGLEGALTAGRTKRIINENILPSFSENNYDEGVLLGFEEILNYIEVEYDISLSSRGTLSDDYLVGNSNSSKGVPSIFLIIGVMIFLFIDFKFFRGWLTFSLLRGVGSSRGGSSSGRSGGSRGGGGRSGGGGAGGRW